MESAADKASDKASDRDGERAGDKAGDKAGQPLRTSVWLEGKPAARGRKSERTDHPTGLDRDRIIAVSVRLLDAEGPAKFSMRRLAAELGVTAMSLYWYVDTKDDLLELALDSVYTEIVTLPGTADDGTQTDWRDELRELAVSYRALLVRHPWVSPLVGKFLNIGPHSMEFSTAVQRVMRGTGLPAHGQMGALSAVFQFVYGFGTIEGHFVQRCAEAGMTQDQYHRHAMGSIHEQPEYQGRFEQAEEMMEARGGETVEEMRERDFTFALDVLVAGIETMRERG
ncbi:MULTISPECIES: TetR/AcrR family transcriptional regulator [Streptomyces]|uniref:TetR/AcrR family transcriptional regulator n=1 Tax=Streptomyces TaxID=1883 RepID=UPI00099F4980|nr:MULTISPECIES: TetR/AcrR family transcriptional regulator C-terminal domain-containing protein [Streptomyces]TFI30624.1 TetR family transcriptional regulator [Streptomyces sp. 4R-3d]